MSGGRVHVDEPLERRTYRVEDLMELLDIGRSSAYELANQGFFKTVRIGSAIRISKKSFDEWLDKQEISLQGEKNVWQA